MNGNITFYYGHSGFKKEMCVEHEGSIYSESET